MRHSCLQAKINPALLRVMTDGLTGTLKNHALQIHARALMKAVPSHKTKIFISNEESTL